MGIGYDVVLNVKPTVATAGYKALETAFAQTLSRFRQSLDKAIDSEQAK
jgi:RNase P protein component